MGNEIVLSKSTALNIADILQSWLDTNEYRPDVERYIQELKGEL